MNTVFDYLVWLAILAPLFFALLIGFTFFLGVTPPVERVVYRTSLTGLIVSVLANFILLLYCWDNPAGQELSFGSWLASGSYEIPLLLKLDRLALSFACLAALLTWVVAHFSKTYLHREVGFIRFFFMLGLFATGTQLVAYAGSLDLMFAGWETLGIASTLFIGFFHERAEPLRSSIRALVTYRICDFGFLLATVATHEWLGSTKLSVFSRLSELPPIQAMTIAGLFMLSAAGKSALLPFSGWLARAMEGPTPSSALFYGGVTIHAGLFLLLRVSPDIDQYPLIQNFGVFLGLATAFYAISVANVLSDAKGKLAHATLAQVGLIFAEIALDWNRLALIHLVSHALLRVWQYLRAPNVLHDSHRIGGTIRSVGLLKQKFPRVNLFVYSHSLHRWRIDEWFDFFFEPLNRFSRWLNQPKGNFRLW